MSPLSDKVIHIVGPRILQNELIASFLMKGSSAACFIHMDQIPDTDRDNYGDASNYLALIDYQEGTLEKNLSIINREKNATTIPLVAIFNVKKGTEFEKQALELGVQGIFYDHDPLDVFLKGIKAIFKGEVWMSRDIMSQYLTEQNKLKPKQMMPMLTKREMEILLALIAGLSNDEISDKFCISVHTVKTHVFNIYKKINVPNRVQAIIWAKYNLNR
jgi:DNA-binding NarL/FixJ family response regulator